MQGSDKNKKKEYAETDEHAKKVWVYVFKAVRRGEAIHHRLIA